MIRKCFFFRQDDTDHIDGCYFHTTLWLPLHKRFMQVTFGFFLEFFANEEEEIVFTTSTILNLVKGVLFS